MAFYLPGRGTIVRSGKDEEDGKRNKSNDKIVEVDDD